jgi:predicted transposase YdaD
MVKTSDIGGKRLISLAPDLWAQWVTQCSDVVAQEILGSEFEWVSRANDVLLKAYSPQEGEFLILNELQLRHKANLSLRMKAYAGLAQEKYNLPVYPVLVNILPPPEPLTISDRFRSSIFGLESRQDYRVINLWEVEAELVFEQSLNVLLPFVPILKSGGEAATVQRALNELRSDETLVELESLLAFLARFVLDSELVSQIMRWDMVVLRESPWYQEILSEGEIKGRQEGRQEEGVSLVLRQLNRRLGSVSSGMSARVQSLSVSQVEMLGEALLDFTDTSDLEGWMRSHQLTHYT